MDDSPELPDSSAAAADPLVAAILNFEPVPRMNKRKDGWTPPLQRQFIALLAQTGSPSLAAEAMGKNRYGVEKLYKAQGADGFRAAWDGAVALFEQRSAAARAHNLSAAQLRPPGIDRRRKGGGSCGESAPLPGQVRNEHGEWEDEGAYGQRVEDARDRITMRLLNCRRLYLHEISGCPGKRAAFEILTEIPVDWEKAERLEAQPDEPWHRPNHREPDMVLTAQAGWMNEMTNEARNEKKEALQRAVDAYRAERGLEPVEWSEGAEE